MTDALELARRPDLDAVLVAVPPDLQPAVAREAVAAGKAVFLEKPGALTPGPLEELAAMAEARGVPVAMNLVMRANPLIACLRAWYRAGWLGLPERWHVENWAGGGLPADHWFWDRSRSGGVLVEHGVHFFDEAAWVLGGKPVRAWGSDWPHPRLPEARARAMAVVEYQGEPVAHGGRPWHLVASFYHGFVRQGEEYQVRELGFESGWVRIEGWIPRRLEAELRLAPEARAGLEQAAAGLVGADAGAADAASGPAQLDAGAAVAAEGPARLAAGLAFLKLTDLPDGRVRVEAGVAGGEETYREMIREGFIRLRRAAGKGGEVLAPLRAAADAIRVARAASGTGTWQVI